MIFVGDEVVEGCRCGLTPIPRGEVPKLLNESG